MEKILNRRQLLCSISFHYLFKTNHTLSIIFFKSWIKIFVVIKIFEYEIYMHSVYFPFKMYSYFKTIVQSHVICTNHNYSIQLIKITKWFVSFRIATYKEFSIVLWTSKSTDCVIWILQFTISQNFTPAVSWLQRIQNNSFCGIVILFKYCYIIYTTSKNHQAQ